jgi:hypothetical protein
MAMLLTTSNNNDTQPRATDARSGKYLEDFLFTEVHVSPEACNIMCPPVPISE